MANKQGTNDVVDSFIGDKLIEARYIGQTKYFDAFTDVSGTLPLTYTSRASQVLKNYRMYGTASGAGVEMTNLYDATMETGVSGAYLKQDGSVIEQSGWYITDYIPCDGTAFTLTAEGTTGGNPSICLYDENKVFIAGQRYNNTLTIVVTSEQIAKYIRFTRRSNWTDIKLVEGSVPWSFKIPLSVNTENLFDETYPSIGSTMKYLPIKVGTGSFTLTTTCPRTDNNAALLFFFEGNVSTGASTQTNGVWSGHPLTVQSSDGYVTIAYRILSSVSPADYSTRLTYDADYTLYIGSSKLGEEEYADYADGKVYKRTENLWNGTSYGINVYLDDSGNVAPATGWSITDYVSVSENTQYTLCNIRGNAPSLCFYDNSQNYIYGTKYDSPGITTNKTYTTPNGTAYIRFSVPKEETYVEAKYIMLVEGSTAPSTYVPYLQPTDPPSPLPAISAVQGENTLSSTETVGTVTVKGRIKEIET